jgi:hypothetical protein
MNGPHFASSNPLHSLSHIHFLDKFTLLKTTYGSRLKYFNTRNALPFNILKLISSKYVISHPLISSKLMNVVHPC